MVIEISVELAAPADRVWEAVERPETLGLVTRGAVGFRVPGGFPPLWREGDTLRLRPMLLHFLPLSRVIIQVARVDREERILETRERVGPIRRWRHRLRVTPIGTARCRYTERAEARAGPLTPFVWASLQALFRWRGWRWRALARSL